SRSTVVWNPWQATAEKMGDLGEQGYLRMLCVESANAAENQLDVEAGETHSLVVSYSVEGMG
ncbi:MAG: D-hexose-6-phosphate mutarotase, partial [Gammaproteobacteria bacterium]|nr:D-hexose-6-phosphate mutarotase [Gammaproteobacteria bacterium]